jgi:hypothetical protein
MSELLNTRCTRGTLIITETHIVVRLRDFQSKIMPREAFTGLDKNAQFHQFLDSAADGTLCIMVQVVSDYTQTW